MLLYTLLSITLRNETKLGVGLYANDVSYTNEYQLPIAIIRGYYVTEVCLLVILALGSHIGTRALARVPMWLSSANMTKRHTSDIS